MKTAVQGDAKEERLGRPGISSHARRMASLFGDAKEKRAAHLNGQDDDPARRAETANPMHPARRAESFHCLFPCHFPRQYSN